MKTVIAIISLIATITIVPAAFADIQYDQEVRQTIKIQIGNDGNVHVIHDIDYFQGSAKLEFLDGTRSNFDILCILCHVEKIYEFDNPDQIFEESEYMVFSQYPAAQDLSLIHI